MSIGRLTEQKNHNMLIEAFALIKKQYKKIILVIIGEGLLRNKLLLKIKKKIRNSIIILNNNSNVQIL